MALSSKDAASIPLSNQNAASITPSNQNAQSHEIVLLRAKSRMECQVATRMIPPPPLLYCTFPFCGHYSVHPSNKNVPSQKFVLLPAKSTVGWNATWQQG